MKNHAKQSEWIPSIGARYLAPSGRVWTVHSITPRGNRAVITHDSPDGEHGAVVDFTAISRMIALDAAPASPPATRTSGGPGQEVPITASVNTPPETANAHG